MTKNDAPAHPDIEIYIRSVTLQAIEDWLKLCFDQVQPSQPKAGKQARKVHHYRVSNEGHAIAVMVVENATGAFSSVLFESDRSPWRKDIDCARQAFAHFVKEVRCIASGWNDGDEPDEWIAINDTGENTILWPG